MWAKAILQGKVQKLHLKITDPDDPLVCDHYVLRRVISLQDFILFL